MRKVGITYHPKLATIGGIVEQTRARIAAAVPDVWVASAWDEAARDDHVPGTDLIICLGGDGTVLRAARAAVPHPAALLGVNVPREAGRLGFLTEVTVEQLWEKLDGILAGEGRIESRSMVETETYRGGEEMREHFHALNDVVVGRPAIGRTVQFAVRTDHATIGNYRADGVIVSTATGSTAYSLSVGGPILHPESREIVVTPVAPHLSPANSVVLPGGASVEIEVAQSQRAILSIDGQPDLDLAGGDIVRVHPSEYTARFLRLGPPGDFYLRVGRRLNWLSE